ncbi:MAG TPA: glycosyltransferase family A protein [Cyclobacteriaceae bacterium]
MHLVSVLMPAFNADRFITEAIDSIIKQSYPNWELLVCDDGSTDSTWEKMNAIRDSRIRLFRNSSNQGKAKTVNELFKAASGSIITVHDADDVSLPQRFSRVIEFLEAHPELTMCGHSIQRMTLGGRLLPLYRLKASDHEEIMNEMLQDNTSGDASLFVRRAVLDDLGEVYRPYFKNNMDYDLALRVIEKYRVANIPEVLLLYRNVPDSISKRVITYHKLVTQEVTKALALERRQKGTDALQRGDWAEIKRLEEAHSQPFLADKTLHLRKMASFFMYCKMNREAIRYMTIAIKEEPLRFENWRTLQYCIRKTLLGR